MYHADRDKESVSYTGGRRQVLVELEGQNQAEIELNGASAQFAFKPCGGHSNFFKFRLNPYHSPARALSMSGE
jgi:hypothetical protein